MGPSGKRAWGRCVRIPLIDTGDEFCTLEDGDGSRPSNIPRCCRKSDVLALVNCSLDFIFKMTTSPGLT